MIDLSPEARVSGSVRLDGQDVYAMRDVTEIRRRVGFVAPLPVGLPMSIHDNVAFAPRMAGIRDRRELRARVERCLRQAALWDEVQDRLADLGMRLSGRQQQRPPSPPGRYHPHVRPAFCSSSQAESGAK